MNEKMKLYCCAEMILQEKNRGGKRTFPLFFETARQKACLSVVRSFCVLKKKWKIIFPAPKDVQGLAYSKSRWRAKGMPAA